MYLRLYFSYDVLIRIFISFQVHFMASNEAHNLVLILAQ